MVYRFFNKRFGGSGIKSRPNQQSITRKFKRRRAYSSFKDNIWGVHLADMQSIDK